jgi:hypothetical protein
MTRRVFSADTSMSRRPNRGQVYPLKLLMFAALLFAFALPYSRGEEPMTPQAKEYLRKLDEPIVLRGDYFKAAMVAHNDFLKVLAENAALAKMSRPAAQAPSLNADLYARLSKIENFDMSIQQSDSTYTVQIGPTLRGDMPLVFGGVTIYQIDKKTFAITSKTRLK